MRSAVRRSVRCLVQAKFHLPCVGRFGFTPPRTAFAKRKRSFFYEQNTQTRFHGAFDGACRSGKHIHNSADAHFQPRDFFHCGFCFLGGYCSLSIFCFFLWIFGRLACTLHTPTWCLQLVCYPCKRSYGGDLRTCVQTSP